MITNESSGFGVASCLVGENSSVVASLSTSFKHSNSSGALARGLLLSGAAGGDGLPADEDRPILAVRALPLPCVVHRPSRGSDSAFGLCGPTAFGG